MANCVVALGSNLGSREENISAALGLFARECEVAAVSSLYETPPVGYADQGDFLNAAALLKTELGPLALLDLCNEIEARLGRKRTFKNAPRPIDADIIFYGSAELDTPRLSIPHPRWLERDFVLTPLLDLYDAGAFSLAGLEKYGTISASKKRKFSPYKT